MMGFENCAHDFQIQVPAGIFLPSIAIGASLGCAVGLLVSVEDFVFTSSLTLTKHTDKQSTIHGPLCGSSLLAHLTQP